MTKPLPTLPPGVSFVAVMHDEDCPGRYENGRGCTCEPEFEVHTSVQRVIDNENHNRAMRRKAAREAERALKRAARKGGRRA